MYKKPLAWLLAAGLMASSVPAMPYAAFAATPEVLSDAEVVSESTVQGNTLYVDVTDEFNQAVEQSEEVASEAHVRVRRAAVEEGNTERREVLPITATIEWQTIAKAAPAGTTAVLQVRSKDGAIVGEFPFDNASEALNIEISKDDKEKYKNVFANIAITFDANDATSQYVLVKQPTTVETDKALGYLTKATLKVYQITDPRVQIVYDNSDKSTPAFDVTYTTAEHQEGDETIPSKSATRSTEKATDGVLNFRNGADVTDGIAPRAFFRAVDEEAAKNGATITTTAPEGYVVVVEGDALQGFTATAINLPEERKKGEDLQGNLPEGTTEAQTKELKDAIDKAKEIEEKLADPDQKDTVTKDDITEARDNLKKIIDEINGTDEGEEPTPTPTQADQIDPKVPANKVQVENPDQLTPEEKEKVKDAIDKANKTDDGESTLPEKTTITIDDKGNATITYPDGSKDTIEGDQLVEKKEPTQADKIDPKVPANKVQVENPDQLTPEEKEKVKDAIDKANKTDDGESTLPEKTTITIDDKGNATITYPDGSKDTIDKDQLVEKKKDDDKKPTPGGSGGNTGGGGGYIPITGGSTTPSQNDKDKVKEEIKKLQDKLDDATYTQETTKNAEDAIKDAEKLLKNPTATQKDYKNMIDRLQKANQGLRTASDLETILHAAYMYGYPDGTFQAERPMTRAEVAVMFYRLTKKDGATTHHTAPYSDVQETDWYANALGYMAANNLISGYPDGTFRPNAPISRAEFAAMATRFAHIADDAQGTEFTDVAKTDWYYGTIQKASRVGWVAGYKDGSFRPNDPITRASAVAITNRMLNREADLDFAEAHNITRFTDLTKEHWAYADIVEATNGHDYTRDKNGHSEHWVELNQKEFK